MKFIIVPDWILPALKMAGKDYTALSNLDWTTTLSKQDVSFYDYIVDVASDLFPSAVQKTAKLWLSLNNGNADWDWTTHYRFKEDFQIMHTHEPGLQKFLSLTLSDTGDIPAGSELGFDVIYEADDVFYVRPKAVSYRDMTQCYDQVFTVLNKKYGLEKIVNMPLFSDYESRLAGAAL